MRLPSGGLDELSPLLAGRRLALLGCVSFEQRSTALPIWLNQTFENALQTVHLLSVPALENGYPDFSSQASQKTAENEGVLVSLGIRFERFEVGLLAVEDQLVDVINNFIDSSEGCTVVLDITSLPKRIFCFSVRMLLASRQVENVIVTYTEAGEGGYAKRLAYSPLQPDHLPGFPFGFSDSAQSLVVSVGYELLGMRSLVESYVDKSAPRFLLSLASNGSAARRQWATLKFLAETLRNVNIPANVAVIPVWDAERVFMKAKAWLSESSGLVLAPFGPKPHTLGLTLFAIATDSALVYTQPRSYDPQYTVGVGNTRGYLVKWGGTACYERTGRPI